MGQKLAIVTGTSSGIGYALTDKLLAEGWRVFGIARREVKRPEEGYRHVQADLAEPGVAETTVGPMLDVETAFGDFDRIALVNNAAVGTDGLLPTMHNRDIEDAIMLNVTSPIVLSKYMVRPMLSRRRGRIVNISSIVAQTGYRGLATYGATKAALEGFTRSLARDVGPRGITVNTVAPGFLETDMTATLGSRDLERIRGRAALNRFAPTDDVAAAVTFLLSEPAASITGTTLTVDAGSTA